MFYLKLLSRYLCAHESIVVAAYDRVGYTDARFGLMAFLSSILFVCLLLVLYNYRPILMCIC